jgi:hypothetical protein
VLNRGFIRLRNAGRSPVHAIANMIRDIPLIVIRNTLAVAIIAPDDMRRTADGVPVTPIAAAKGDPDCERPGAPTSPMAITLTRI